LLTSSSSKRRNSSSRGGRKRRRRSRRDHRRRQTTRHLSSISQKRILGKIVSLSKNALPGISLYTHTKMQQKREREKEREGCTTPHYKVQYNERCEMVSFFDTRAVLSFIMRHKCVLFGKVTTLMFRVYI